MSTQNIERLCDQLLAGTRTSGVVRTGAHAIVLAVALEQDAVHVHGKCSRADLAQRLPEVLSNFDTLRAIVETYNPAGVGFLAGGRDSKTTALFLSTVAVAAARAATS